AIGRSSDAARSLVESGRTRIGEPTASSPPPDASARTRCLPSQGSGSVMAAARGALFAQLSRSDGLHPLPIGGLPRVGRYLGRLQRICHSSCVFFASPPPR